MAMNGNHQINGFHRPNGIRGGGVLHGGGGGGGFFTRRVHRFFYWSLIFFLTNSFIIFICHHKVDQAQTNGSSNIMFSYNKNENKNEQHQQQKQKAPEAHQQEQAEETEKDNELPIFAICLLTRDDIPILSEWIAYHYHAVNLRHLIVAVDPNSKQNPKPMFDKFRNYLGKNSTHKNDNENDNDYLIIDQWSDIDFMPQYFLNGEYGLAPNFVGNIENPDQSTWYDWYSTKKGFGYHKRQDQTLVNNHRYRQTRFLSKCSHYLKTKYSKNNSDNNNNHRNIWMSTLDTDEYLAINPWMMNIPDNNNNNDKSKTKTKHENDDDNETEMAALRLEAGSVLRYLVNHSSNNKNKTKNNNGNNGNVCIPIPRLLFGSVELNTSTTTTTTTVAAADATTIKRDVTSGLIRTKRSRTDEEEYGTSYSSNNVELAYNLPRSRSTMETLRWKYHASPYDDRNFQQKVILNLNDIPYNDEIFNNINNHVHTVHRPSRILCLPESTTNFNGTLLVGRTSNDDENINNDNNGGGDGEGDGEGDVTLKIITQSPVVAYHYIGSEERYFSRPNDLRRNPKRYRERSNITYQRSNDYNWIDQWLVRFIEGDGDGEGGINGGVGIEVASILLQDHIIDVDDV